MIYFYCQQTMIEGETLELNIDKLLEFSRVEEISIPTLASILGVEYSYLTRVLKKEKSGGIKLFGGIYKLCKERKMDIEEFVFFA